MAEAAGVAWSPCTAAPAPSSTPARPTGPPCARCARRSRIPVIVNGDIDGPAAARTALARSGAAGVMVGRAARGRPWLLGQIAAALAGRPVPAAPTGQALRDLVAGHYEAMLGFYGRDLGLRCARKHLGWYCDAAGAAADFRSRLLRTDDPAEVLRALVRPWPAAPAEGLAA
jgi:tRNA-dihydrouridine synthase B